MYFFYFDESGSRDPDAGQAASGGPAKDHLYVLVAIGIFERNWQRLERGISHVKLELADYLRRDGKGRFELADCEVKSNWLRYPTERAKKSPFLAALTDDDRTRLAECFYLQLQECRATIFAVVVDKRHLHDHMTHDTLHKKAYEMILERIEHFMAEYHPKHQALIVMDHTSPRLNRSVAMKHAFFQRAGNPNVQFRHIVEYPFFTASELSNGVQLADLCAYNVYRAFKSSDFAYPYFARMLPYFYRRQNGPQLDGLKVWPEGSDLVRFARDAWSALERKSPAMSGA